MHFSQNFQWHPTSSPTSVDLELTVEVNWHWVLLEKQVTEGPSLMMNWNWHKPSLTISFQAARVLPISTCDQNTSSWSLPKCWGFPTLGCVWLPLIRAVSAHSSFGSQRKMKWSYHWLFGVEEASQRTQTPRWRSPLFSACTVFFSYWATILFKAGFVCLQ